MAPLPGATDTGVWRSQLLEGVCPPCQAVLEAQRQKEQRAIQVRRELVQLLGGEKPYREFTFERYEVTPGNRLAYERCRQFDPATENLYLWGACGVGKTHLASAVARKCSEAALSVHVLPAFQLSRRVRMKGLDQEQTAISELIDADALVLDDLGTGSDTPYGRQLLQEILDARNLHDRGGIVITSKYSLAALAQKLDEDSVPSRLGGMCRVIQLNGLDHRVAPRGRS